MIGLRRAAVGEHGFERAAVWSVVGFALTVVAVRTTRSVGPLDAAAITAACAGIAAVGVVAYAAVGGGILPCVLLAYGPFAALVLETLGPRIRLVANGGVEIAGASGSWAEIGLALVEPLGGALAGAVAVGTAGYVIGQAVAAVVGTGPEEDPDGTDPAAD